MSVELGENRYIKNIEFPSARNKICQKKLIVIFVLKQFAIGKVSV